MRNKLLILFISFYAVGCLCPKNVRNGNFYEVDLVSFKDAKFYNIYTTYDSINNFNILNTTPLTTGVINNIDTLGISFNFNTTIRRIALNYGSFNLINTAYACKQAYDGYTLKYKIDSISIISDTIYNGINAGVSLNTLFKYNASYSGNYYGINKLIEELNSSSNFRDDIFSNIFLITDIKPDFNTKHKLFIKIYKANSEIIEGETIPFAWY